MDYRQHQLSVCNTQHTSWGAPAKDWEPYQGQLSRLLDIRLGFGPSRISTWLVALRLKHLGMDIWCICVKKSGNLCVFVLMGWMCCDIGT